MGHLGNPIAFRLSYNKKWLDTWFVKNLYYPEFLNKMLNVRDYLYYFFTKKSMLKSGNCLSHLNIIKIQKSYIIKIYIYSIDLEKLSYDFINKIYNLYYTTLKLHTGKISGVTKDVLKQKLAKKRVINELQNSDLFAFIFIYYFFDLFVRKRNEQYLKSNSFISNVHASYFRKLQRKYINYIFFKLEVSGVRKNSRRLIPSYVKKRKLLRFLKIMEQRKRKSLIVDFFKSKMASTKRINQINKLRLKRNLKPLILKKKNNKEEKAYLSYFKNVLINKSYWKSYKLYFSKFKIKNFLVRDLNRKIYKTLNDTLWCNRSKHKHQFNFYDFFFYLLKKTKFEKFNNTVGLYKKWSTAKTYFDVLKKVFTIKNKTAFYFLLQAFISINRMVSNFKFKKKFRDGIYLSLYNLLGKFFFLGLWS